MRSPLAIVLGVLAVAPAVSAVDHLPREDLIPAVQPESATETPTEAELAYRIEATVADLPGMRCGDVHAHVQRGVVTLAGEVPGRRTHDRLVLAVHGVDGVRILRDELSVSPLCAVEVTHNEADPGARVAAAVASVHQADGQPLAVRWDGGRVMLAGTMATWGEARRALSAARAAARTQRIHSELTVGGEVP